MYKQAKEVDSLRKISGTEMVTNGALGGTHDHISPSIAKCFAVVDREFTVLWGVLQYLPFQN